MFPQISFPKRVCFFKYLSITFFAAPASSQQRLRPRYFVTPDNSIMTRAGQAGIAGNVRETEADVELSSKQPPKMLPEVIAPHREVHGFPTKGKYGPDLWQTSLTNVLPPFRRQFFPAATSPLLLSFLSVGFVRLAQLLLAHILLILSAQIMSTCMSLLFWKSYTLSSFSWQFGISYFLCNNVEFYLQPPRVAKSNLNSTDAYFATKKLAPKKWPKNDLELPKIAQK